MDDKDLQSLLDYFAVTEVILRFARALDLKDWKLCRSCFLDEIEADYSAFRGKPSTIISADEFVELRREALKNLKTLHLSANHAVEVAGDIATCISGMVIYRFLPEENEHFDSFVYYHHTLVRNSVEWKISKVKQTLLWNEGNSQIHKGAKQQ